MSITAKELAKKLNLSAAAVSMALNGKPGVSTRTRKLVLETAENYGYDFTKIAEKNHTVGSIYFVIFKKHGAIVDDTPFFSQVSEGILSACKDAGYKLNIRYIYGDEDDVSSQLEEIQFSDCIGIILLAKIIQTLWDAPIFSYRSCSLLLGLKGSAIIFPFRFLRNRSGFLNFSSYFFASSGVRL